MKIRCLYTLFFAFLAGCAAIPSAPPVAVHEATLNKVVVIYARFKDDWGSCPYIPRACLWYTGSGVIVGKKEILGALHVDTHRDEVKLAPQLKMQGPLKRPDKIEIKLRNGAVHAGRLIWFDKATDLAVVTVEEALPAPISIRASPLRLGEAITLIGPGNTPKQWGISSGVITKTNYPLFYTNVRSGPGASGGAIIDADGKLVGIHLGGSTFAGAKYSRAVSIAAFCATYSSCERLSVKTPHE